MIIEHTPFDKEVIDFLLGSLSKVMPNVAQTALYSDWKVFAYDFQQKIEIPQMSNPRGSIPALLGAVRAYEATLQFDQGAVVSWELPFEDGEYLADLFAKASLNQVPTPPDLKRRKTDRPRNFEPVMKTVTNAHLGISRAHISMKAAPSRPGVSIPARVLVCDCPVSPVEKFFCPRIDAELLVGSEKLFDLPGCDLSQRAANPVGNAVEFLLPLFGSVLHRITISSEAYTSWDGNDKIRLRIEPHSWLDPDGVIFVSSDGSAGLKELAEGLVQAYRVATDSVTMNQAGRLRYKEWWNYLRSGFNGPPTPIICANPSNGFAGHNFGTAKKLLEWIQEPNIGQVTEDVADMATERDKRVLAEVFASLTYGTCYICYKNRETAFAMIDL